MTMNDNYNIELELKTCKFFLFAITTLLILMLIISSTLNISINKQLFSMQKEIINSCEYIKDNNVP